MTLVDVLAGIAVLALAAAILIPLGRSASAGAIRLRERYLAHSVLAAAVVPTTPEGTTPMAGLPEGTLRWTSVPVPIARGSGGTMMARVVVMQVVRRFADDTVVLAERRLPSWDGP